MSARPSRSGSPVRPADSTEHHRHWLGLVDIDGPFLSIPVLTATWPTLDALDAPTRSGLRTAHAAWQAEPRREQHTWIQHVLHDLLGWGDALLRHTGDELAAFGTDVAEHDTRIQPDFAFVTPGDDAKPDTTHLLGLVCPPGVHPASRPPDDTWSAPLVDRLARVCRARGVPLGLVTDGRWWTLLRSRQGKATTLVTFDAIGWNEAAERDVVRAFVSLLCRRRFLAVPAEETLPALLDASEDSGEALTEALGGQVRQAVELLLAAVGRADSTQRERGELGLACIDAAEIYQGCVTTLMRLVFLLFAEQRGLLPADRELYARAYSVDRLGAELEEHALRDGEDELEHRYAAWHRLLALFDAVYFGVDHPRLWIYPHDGSLFDTTRFRWFPRQIDDRTVLHMLRALQYVETGHGRAREPRKLSFRELDVEQLGYIYEHLLDHDGCRAGEVTLGLLGKPGLQRRITLRELETLADAHPDDLGTRLAERCAGSGFGGAATTARRLAPLTPEEHREHWPKLLAATHGDRALAERLLPYARLIRHDLRGLPMVTLPGQIFLTDSPLRGNTGTHYTPRSLTERIVEPGLEPLLYRTGPLHTDDTRRWQFRSSDELLSLKVADIAMGSGAFLVAAARYLGDALLDAWAREGDERAMAAKISRAIDDADDPARIHARRQVIEHCLYGVDINPTAVEVAKVSLWLVSLDPEKPFTFLDDRLVAGDSLLGITHTDQLRHMHHDPAVGRELHHDLFGFTDSIDAVVEKSAMLRRRITDLPFTGEPLEWLDDKRKLLAEAEETTHELRQVGDLLIGGMFAGVRDGADGLDRGAVRAAKLGNELTRHGDEDAAHQAWTWLRTDRSRDTFLGTPLHWPLVFADVFDPDSGPGGFDAIIGNQPYLGGQKLTGVLGRAYREYLVHTVGRGVRGSADLIAYWVLRTHALLKPGGVTGLVATNTLAQGDTREVGLDQLVADGVGIRRSIKSEKWPSRSAALEYAAVWTSRAPLPETVTRIADGVPVSGITTSLEPASRVTGRPHRLAANTGLAFQGSNILGLGFTMEPEHAHDLIARDPRNRNVLFPYLNGQDLNTDPGCAASRWVINFHDWTEEQAQRYPDCYEQVRRLVKPERAKNRDKRRRELWWRFTRPAPDLYAAIADLGRVIVLTIVSKTVMPVMVPTGQVFAHRLCVFATEDTAMLTLLSSSPHYWWTASYTSTLETRINYSPSDVFETFPLPELTPELRELGDRLDTRRREIMHARNTGLTKIYNLVFDPDINEPDITELRELHRAIDEATIRAYGWHDLLDHLDHGFHPAGTDTRYTIGPAAQREILDRLLELNHQRHAVEPARGSRTRRSRRKSGAQDTLL